MSYSITLKRAPKGKPKASLAKYWAWTQNERLWSMPQRGMSSILYTMEFVGVVPSEGLDGPEPYPAGQVPREKFDSNDGHHVTAKECAIIAQALGELIADEDELESLYDCFDYDEEESEELYRHISAWCELNRLGVKSDGYTVS